MIHPQHFFVTSTGTGIGKTFVAAMLTRALRQRGVAAHACKPIISGYDEAANDHDTALLLQAMGRENTPEEHATISPWRFAAPLSPHRAAELEGKSLDVEALVTWCHNWLDDLPQGSVGLIEGVGGCMVPLTYEKTVLDWIQALKLPVILVVGSYLGTLSHSLTALHCLHQAGVPLHMVIMSRSQEDEDTDAEAGLATLRRMSPYQSSEYVMWQRFQDDNEGDLQEVIEGWQSLLPESRHRP